MSEAIGHPVGFVKARLNMKETMLLQELDNLSEIKIESMLEAHFRLMIDLVLPAFNC